MSTQGSVGSLTQASRILQIEWERTKESWRDAKSIEFQQRYLADLPVQIATAVNAMEELDLLLKKVRNDCE